jgi:hypothetical protein
LLNHWFYSHSTWDVAGAVCSVVVLLPLIGLFIFHRLVNWHVREENTSMVGLSYALCGGIYAVVLAFVAVGTYEAMDRAQRLPLKRRIRWAASPSAVPGCRPNSASACGLTSTSTSIS